MLPWSVDLRGRLDREFLTSDLLAGNVLGDPHRRPLWVYLPPGYDDQPATSYPSVCVLQGYAGHVAMWDNRDPFRQPFVERADELFATGGAPGCVLVFVDAWTAFGGSQIVDSPGTRAYHSYLCEEVVPWVDAHYRTLTDPQSRAICGKSSGGFGAMITPMLRPDLLGALATHAGDTLYELCYLPEVGSAARGLRGYDGDIMSWWSDFGARVSFTKAEDDVLLNLLGCAACFSARPDGTPELPFDPLTGVLRPEVWQRWLDWDPVRMVARYADQVRGLRAVWVDAGTRDDFFLDIGAQAFRAELAKVGLPDDRVFFELFDGTHDGIDYRYPQALAWLAHRLAR